LNFKKLILSGIICIVIAASSVAPVYGQGLTHTVRAGDTYWIISQKYNISIDKLMALNNANQDTIIYVGQKIQILDNSPYQTIHTVSRGETFWIISQKFGVDINRLMDYNNSGVQTILHIGQTLRIPSTQSSQPYITYKNYTVVRGDILWSIANKFGVTVNELIEANSSINPDSLVIGDVIKIPVHHIPVKSTPGEKYGEMLDWWTEAQYVIPINADFEVVDFYTGKSFYARRTTGANHADCEPLTLSDTNKMKEIWGGYLSWTSRPVVIKYNGRKIAASASSMAHAGNDAAPGGVYTTWRSGSYGAGTNFDWVKNNGFDGHFDIHFLNSTRHTDGKQDPNHQYNVKISAGISR
jgi:peptidoglycan DL-endopeptidase CwlS